MFNFFKKNYTIEKITEEQAVRFDVAGRMYAYFRIIRELDQYKIWLYFFLSLPVLVILIFDTFSNVKIIEIFFHLTLIIPLAFLYYLIIYIYETKNKKRTAVMQNVMPKLNEALYIELSKSPINILKNVYKDLKISKAKWNVRRWTQGSLIIYTIMVLAFLAWKTQITLDALIVLASSDPYNLSFFAMFLVFSICMTRFLGNLIHQKRLEPVFLILEKIMEEKAH